MQIACQDLLPYNAERLALTLNMTVLLKDTDLAKAVLLTVTSLNQTLEAIDDLATPLATTAHEPILDTMRQNAQLWKADLHRMQALAPSTQQVKKATPMSSRNLLTVNASANLQQRVLNF
jgi:hypothetical protein